MTVLLGHDNTFRSALVSVLSRFLIGTQDDAAINSSVPYMRCCNSLWSAALIYYIFHLEMLDVALLFQCVNNDPERPVSLQFRQSSDAPIRRVRRPRCLAEHGDRVWTDNGYTSHLNARPASRCHGCGCPLPATVFVAQRCPLSLIPCAAIRVRMTLTPYSASTAMNRWPSIRLLSWCQIGRNPSSDLRDRNVASSSISRQ